MSRKSTPSPLEDRHSLKPLLYHKQHSISNTHCLRIGQQNAFVSQSSKGAGQKKTVFVAMSGGVDSSVAALLLKKQGYDVTGVFMRCYNLDGCAERDAEDARRVAEHIGIPFYIFDFEKEYKKKVVEYMIDGYKKGITPNPDVMCNKEIKFGLFLKKALELGAEYVATGHYVKLVVSSKVVSSKKLQTTNYKLQTARDVNKDQSYFLWTLTQDQLQHCLFPIGDYLKPKVREIARKAELPTAEKKDSQGICFLGKVSIKDFLKNYIKPKKGDVLDIHGKKIGEHEGSQFYTIGQRHLGIMNYESGIRGRHETKPFYVADKNVKTNTVIVAEGDDNLALYRKEVKLMNTNFINPIIPSLIRANKKMEVLVRVRYRQPLAFAVLITSNQQSVTSSGLLVTSYRLLFVRPVKFVAPGQSAVLYLKGGEMIGGGVIC